MITERSKDQNKGGNSQFHVSLAQLQTISFMKLAPAGHLTLFVARTRYCFLTRHFLAPILLFLIISTQIVAALIARSDWFVTPISREHAGFIRVYCLFWDFIEDGLK